MRLSPIVGIVAGLSICGLSLASSGLKGLWQTTDHKTNKLSSLVKIKRVAKNNYVGIIQKIYKENGHKTTDVCKKCKGSLHNKPVLGMKILHFQLTHAGNVSNCKILDPNKGTVYHCTMSLQEKGKQLHLRGYVGIQLFGRTDTWIRYTPRAKYAHKKLS